MTAGARITDPDTSHLAAEAGDEEKWSLHRELLLAAWYQAGEDGLTDEEAGDAAHLQGHYWWKRAGELRVPSRGPMSWESGAGAPLVTYDGRSRKGRSGRSRKVSVITEAGRSYALAHGLVEQAVLIIGSEAATLPAGSAVVLHAEGVVAAEPTSAAIHLGDGVLALLNDRGDAVRRRVVPDAVYRVLWTPPR